jgi:phosphocarrier protein
MEKKEIESSAHHKGEIERHVQKGVAIEPAMGSMVNIQFTLKKEITSPKIEGFVQKTLKVIDKYGLHARPVASLVKAFGSCKSTVTVLIGKEKANGKSILDLMLRGPNCKPAGNVIEIRFKGEHAKQEMDDAMVRLFKDSDNNQLEEFKEYSSNIDIRECHGVEEKLKRISELIEIEKDSFLDNTLKEKDLQAIAEELRRLSNMKGIRNDILHLMQREPIKAETSIEVYAKHDGLTIHVCGKDSKVRKIEAKNVSPQLASRFHHTAIIKPLDEFVNEIKSGLSDESHAYAIEWISTKFEKYKRTLNAFLEAPMSDFSQTFSEVLKARMKYEHHDFIDVKN